MSTFGRSAESQTLELNANTNDVAKACQDVLNKIGEVTNASPEMGVIHGMIKRGFLDYDTNIKIQIYKKSDIATTLWITADRSMMSGSIYDNAQYDIEKFCRALTNHPNLRGTSSAVWDVQEVSKPSPVVKQRDASTPTSNQPVEHDPKKRNRLFLVIGSVILLFTCICACLFMFMNGDYLWCLFTGC